MSKTVFMFPGQGAQYVGMGKDFYENIAVCKRIFELASDVTGLDLARLCFEENNDIHVTEYTQIAMLTTEAAILAAVEESGRFPQATVGLSLGEYGALLASKVIGQEDAFRVIRKRGIFMQEAVPSGGAMSAILGLEAGKIEEICAQTEGVVSIANYNCPGQIVITGEAAAVEMASEVCKSAGAKRAVALKVSGPFHSALLKGAGAQLEEVLKDVPIEEFTIPYVANVTADYVRTAAEVKPLLVRQVSAPVRFSQSVERLIADGYDEFVEIGPGKTLSGFVRKINREVKIVNLEKLEDFTNYVGK